MEYTFLEILTYFVIYSLLGWLLESTYRTILEKKIINTGFLKGPFCPIYGFGAIIIIIFFSSFQDNVLALFLVSVIILSLWEYLVGVALEKMFKTKYWDYSNHKFNYKGRICLTNSIEWGILGVIFIKFIHPAIENLLNQVDSIYINIAVIFISLILIIDAIISIIKTKNIEASLQKIEEINEQIKEKIAELKEKTQYNDSKEKLIKELEIKRKRLMKNLYKRVNRLKRAFPAIDTKAFTDILSKKIEFKNKKIDKGDKDK